MVLREALVTLLANKPITKITTTEICALADVNRGTFYTHYTDQYDLLQSIQDDFAAEVLDLQARRRSERMSTQAMLTGLATYFRQQLSLCKVLFTTTGGEDLIARLIRDASTEFIATWPDQATDPDDLEMLYEFIARGSAAVLRHWIMTDATQPPEHIAQLVIKASMHGSASFRK